MEVNIYIVTCLAETFDCNSAESIPFATIDEARHFIKMEVEDIIANYGDDYDSKEIYDDHAEVNYDSEFFNWDISSHTLNI